MAPYAFVMMRLDLLSSSRTEVIRWGHHGLVRFDLLPVNLMKSDLLLGTREFE